MEDLKISSKNYMMRNIRNSFKQRKYGISTDLLMIWLPT